MPNIYIERRGDQYVATEENRDEPFATGDTQEEMIDRAHKAGLSPFFSPPSIVGSVEKSIPRILVA